MGDCDCGQILCIKSAQAVCLLGSLIEFAQKESDDSLGMFEDKHVCVAGPGMNSTPDISPNILS